MNINNDNLFITVAGDSRITPWGEILRFFKLDELPQLWNIAKGDMRFIGPRPEVPEYVSKDLFPFLNVMKLTSLRLTVFNLRDSSIV